jgi:hypothetical protein
MEYIDELEASFQERLSQIFELSRLPLNILEATKPPMDSISASLDEISGFNTVKTKISNQASLVRNLSKNKSLQSQFEIFNSQIVVLMVGALEAHLYDIIKGIGDNNPEFFLFEDNGSKVKKITFEASLLDEKTSVGEIMRHYFKEQDGNVNFQDIQSIVRFFSEKLVCDLDIEDYQDALIFGTAARNVTVHNNQVIDRRFLNQIRNTSHIEMDTEDSDGKKTKRFFDGARLSITENDIVEIKEALLSFVSEISSRIRESHES